MVTSENFLKAAVGGVPTNILNVAISDPFSNFSKTLKPVRPLLIFSKNFV